MRKFERFLAPTLVTLSVLAICGVFSSSGEPLPDVLQGTCVQPILLKLSYPNSIIFNLCLGFITSVFFWILVVYLPDQSRKNLLKENFRRRYEEFRETTIQILLWSGNVSHDSRLPKQLLSHKEFRSFFNENDKMHWYAAINGLQADDDRINDLLLEMELISQEVSYLLNNASIQNQQVHSFFKRLNEHLYRLRHAKVYSDDMVKYVGGFIWEINANWNFVTGYQDDDRVSTMISKL